ncbi:MAG: chlorophyll synthase ChlG [Paracoccaceae bacterium]
MKSLEDHQNKKIPSISSIIILIKPITWFPPMWAFLCGAVSSSNISLDSTMLLLIGLILSGPIVCGMSQAVNDWYDKEVDAINEPDRPIPSGKIPGSWGFWIAVFMSIIGIIISWFLGFWGFFATLIAIVCAWAYSAEPIRLKRSGIIGPSIVALCYEGLPWFTGVAILTSQFPTTNTILVAGIYAFGAFGIMILNDFKAIEGDQKLGINSLPVTLGPKKAGLLSCFIMSLAQIIIIFIFIYLKINFIAMIILLLLCIQFIAMIKMLKNPKKLVPWYNATGVFLYIVGMMVSAIGLGYF